MPQDINVQRRAPSNLAIRGDQSPPRHITISWQICLHRQGTGLMASQVFLSKNSGPINYSVTCSPMLWRYSIQYLQCCEKEYCPTGWVSLMSVRFFGGFFSLAWGLIPSGPERRKRRAAFIAHSRTRRSLEIQECKHERGPMTGLHCVGSH